MSRLKIESARRQLGTALALYLQDQDPVSVHCLAGGGCELIEHYAKKTGAQPFTSHMLQAIPGLDIKEIRALQRKYWNAFKHATHMSGAERNDDKLHREFDDIQNDHALFIGWYDYALATNAMPIEAQAHQVWYIALYPEKLDPKHSITKYDAIFPRIRQKSRAAQKSMLNKAINWARSNPQTMADLQTEKRPLILSW